MITIMKDGLGGMTILLVEHDNGAREFASGVLSGAGHRVLVADDGVEAVNVIRHRSEELDLVITEVLLPKMGGLELHGVAATMAKDLAFVFMSCPSEFDGARIAPLSSDWAFLGKPWTGQTLLATVAQVVHGCWGEGAIS